MTDTTTTNRTAIREGEHLNVNDRDIIAGTADYAKEDQADILWLFGWARSTRRSRQDLCDLLESDWTTITRIARGKYGAAVDTFMGKVRDLRRRVASEVDTGFIETPVTRAMWQTMDYAAKGNIQGGRMAMICGGWLP